MATLASLLVVMGMDTKGLTAGAAKAEGSLAGLGVSAKTLGAVVPAAAALAGVAVVKFAADAVGAASDLNESVNKVKVVFADQADTIMAWAKTTADSFGISEQAALESAGTFGNLFDAMKISSEAGAEMSTTLVELAADLASFNNASPEDVLAAMQSGLTGQIRPLRQYGIEISDAALQQEALAEGITKSTSEMTMAEKVQLRYALIMKQSGNAQGDFARTSDDLANMQRRLTAQFEDLQAHLGTLLLPTVLSVVTALNDLATVILFLTGATEGWDEKIKNASISTANWELGIADFFAKAANGIPIIGDLLDAAHQIGVVMDEAGKGAQLTGDQLDTLAMNINGQSSAYESLRKHWRGVADDFLGFVDFSKEKIPQIEREMNKIPKAFRDTGDALQAEIPNIIGTVTRYKDAFDISPKELQAITHHWAEIAKTIAHDLRVLGDSDLKPAMREAIAALPPEMRHAWVEGNASQRHAIEQSISDTYKVQDQMPALARQALQGGKGVGSSMAEGIVAGIKAGAPFVVIAAENAVQDAINAARHKAGIASPSKVMEEVGHDMISGLVNGLLKNQNALLAAAEKVMSALQDKLSSLVSKSQSFGQGISGGFSSLLGFPTELPEGTNIQDLFSNQVDTAQSFADILQALKTQGAGKGLLAAIASQGIAGIPMAQQLLQQGPEGVAAVNQAYNDIAAIAEKTADALSNQFFGDRIQELRHDVKDQKDVLVDIKQNVKYLEKISNQLADQGGKIDIHIGGSVVTERELIDSIREGLIAAGRSGQGHH